ncbi:hypothetical protein CONPUDRAFT_169378 [Coniophora puteana RWD-64-598 SS2]|uniref:Uncharacterized protein n=1 Tax=Coniophora puteana (strain RWD-64-598) TaxID=741705 RepID=A0A5M3MAC1_CONPW|nr:uncharacterized protein CONPUDRAFT_169378 [Coniophora puteana RWD-64-598 SS2]EIW75575.1 hypothetical protein CONPUDRAFT_169378 [Coniophora puteana RWD-64-598 SS2]
MHAVSQTQTRTSPDVDLSATLPPASQISSASLANGLPPRPASTASATALSGLEHLQAIPMSVQSTTHTSTSLETGGKPSESSPARTPELIEAEVVILTEALAVTQAQLREARAREVGIKRSLNSLGARPLESEEELRTNAELLSELNAAKEEARVERRRRIQAETRLEEVKAERQTPFVVPALLEIFKEISTVTESVSSVVC